MKDEIIKVISEWMMQQDDSIIGDRIAHRQLANDLTALISEHYVAKEEVDKMVSERLREGLIAYGKVVRSWGIAIPSDILECSIDEYLKTREK